MAQQENNKAINKNLKTNILSERDKKFTILGIAIFSFLILILVGLIAEAYINQHPVLEFLQYAVFKPEMKILGSFSFITIYVGFFLYSTTILLFLLYDYQWKKEFLLILGISFFLVSFSFVLLFISCDWQLKYSWCKYVSFVSLTLGVLGQILKITINKAGDVEIPWLLTKLSKLPFYIFMIIGIVINMIFYSYQ